MEYKIRVRGKPYDAKDLTRQQIDYMRIEAGIDNDTCPLCHGSGDKFFMRISTCRQGTYIFNKKAHKIETVKGDQGLAYKEEAEGIDLCHKCICLAGRLASDGDEKRKQRDLIRLGLGKIDVEWLKELGLWQGREYEVKRRRSFEKKDKIVQYKD